MNHLKDHNENDLKKWGFSKAILFYQSRHDKTKVTYSRIVRAPKADRGFPAEIEQTTLDDE